MKNKGAKINTAARLKRCNRSLGLTLLLILVSGIQLEATSGRYAWSVWVHIIFWVHIILGVALTALSLYHIYLHYRTDNWFARFARNRNTVTRILWWVFLLTTVSGLAATTIWLATPVHSHLGAIHGKIGFLMALLAIIHVVTHKRKKKQRLITS